MLSTTISSSVLILAIVLVRYLFRGKLKLRLQYALWLLVAIRLLLPIPSIQSQVSILNVLEPGLSFLPAEETAQAPQPPILGESESGSTIVKDPENTGGEIPDVSPVNPPTSGKTERPSLAAELAKHENALRSAWLAGAIITGLWFAIQNLWFYIQLRKTREKLILPDSRLPVYVSHHVKSPCLFGLNPAIYLPHKNLDKDALRYALAHEETHYRHADHLWAYVRCLCLAIHWHNPFVWWAATLSRQDCEMACDESTLNRIGDEHRKAYGHTLIDMIECSVKPSDLLSCATTMSAGVSAIKERITMIAQKPKMLLSTLLIVVACLVVAVSCTFTGTANDADKDVTKYDREGIVVAIPDKYKDQILVDPVQSVQIGEDTSLISVYHKTNYEKNKGLGFLFTIVRYSQAQYEQYLQTDGSGISFYARDDQWYYGFSFATDVQAPDDQEAFAQLLSELGEYVKYDMITRNNLTPYSDDEFFERPYTYDSPHIILNYYPYYAYDGSKEEVWTLTLSQPARQGLGGIWCVERWTDSNGNVYPYFPDANGIPAAEYYAEIQARCDSGELGEEYFRVSWQSVAQRFVEEVFGHTQATFKSFSIAGRNAPPTSENLFDPYKISVGDSIMGLTVTKTDVTIYDGWIETVIVQFKGEVTLTGRYICYPEEELTESRTPGFPQAVFIVDDESTYKLPQIIGGGSFIFIITNVEEAIELLGPPDSDSEVKATIVIDDYVIRLHPSSEGRESARLVRVIEKEVLAEPGQSGDYTSQTPSQRFSVSTGNIHDYMPRLLAGQAVSEYELLPCLENFTRQTWREFDEFYRSKDPDDPGATGEHWFNSLFTALANAAITQITQNPSYDREDQFWRNYYIGKAYLTSDGAFAQSLADIMMNQWIADPVAYSSTLNQLFPNEKDNLLRQRIAYHIRYFYDIYADDSLFGIVKPIAENQGYPGGIYLAAYPVDFPFCFDLVEKNRKTYRAESFGEVTVVESDDLQVTYLNAHDGLYTIITLRAKASPYQAAGVKIGDTEETLLARFTAGELRKVDGINYDDEAWFGNSYDYAYAYTQKDDTKSLVFIISNGLVTGIEVVNGLDGPLY